MFLYRQPPSTQPFKVAPFGSPVWLTATAGGTAGLSNQAMATNDPVYHINISVLLLALLAYYQSSTPFGPQLIMIDLAPLIDG